MFMATNLALSEELLNEALKVGGLKTKKATVTEALLEFIRHRKQKRLVKLFGTIDWGDYDYKKHRRR